MSPLFNLAVILLLALGWAAVGWWQARLRYWPIVFLAAVMAIVLLDAAGLVLRQVRMRAEIAAAIARAQAECKDGPEVVPFRQGMTLCPGQSAIITVPLPPPEPDGPATPAAAGLPERGI